LQLQSEAEEVTMRVNKSWYNRFMFGIYSVCSCKFALDFFNALREKNLANSAPPPLGLHTLMQTTTAEKVQNMVRNIENDSIAPVEIFAQKP